MSKTVVVTERTCDASTDCRLNICDQRPPKKSHGPSRCMTHPSLRPVARGARIPAPGQSRRMQSPTGCRNTPMTESGKVTAGVHASDGTLLPQPPTGRSTRSIRSHRQDGSLAVGFSIRRRTGRAVVGRRGISSTLTDRLRGPWTASGACSQPNGRGTRFRRLRRERRTRPGQE